MSADLLARPHVWQPGSGSPPLLFLHGTGGDEHDLLVLRQHLAPDAPVLSPRGTVSEHGLARFFRRLEEGGFDEDDLRLRADELAAFLVAAEHKYDVPPGSWLAVGFSNGANMASALLLRHPGALVGAVLLAAMVPFAADEPSDHALAGKRMLIVNGDNDPIRAALATLLFVAPTKNVARFTPKNTPGMYACRTWRRVTRLPVERR